MPQLTRIQHILFTAIMNVNGVVKQKGPINVYAVVFVVDDAAASHLIAIEHSKLH